MIEVNFKSVDPFFNKEEDGDKCCTVRKLSQYDIRFEYLMEIIQADDYGGRKDQIAITNPQTGDIFTRLITDVSYYDKRFIISWLHSNKSRSKK